MSYGALSVLMTDHIEVKFAGFRFGNAAQLLSVMRHFKLGAGELEQRDANVVGIHTLITWTHTVNYHYAPLHFRKEHIA
jgi:hypothetical protein